MSSATDTAQRVRELLADLIAIPSLSGEEAAVADMLSAHASAAGFEVSRHEDNLWFSLGHGDDRLLLNSHLDVVPPSTSHPYPPFEPTVQDGWLYGRGAVDAKASVAAMTVAMIELAESGWQPSDGQLIAAFTACEESGWPYNGLQETRPRLPEINAAVVGEPTSLAPCVAQKGLLILRVTSEGKTAHAARAHLGQNAILGAAQDLLRLQDLDLDRVHPILGPVTVTPTVIEGGSARNVVPDRCSWYLDIRSTPAYTHDELTAIVDEWIESEVEVHSNRLIPVDTDPESRVVQAAVKASPGNPIFGSPTLSDWIFLKDRPVVKIGPGESNRSHTSGERINLDELTRSVGVYRRLIQAYYSNE